MIYHRGFNVLHHAAEHLLPTVIRHLLSSQPQLKKVLNDRTTPLGRVDRWLSLLLQLLRNVTVCCRKDATPLHLAIMSSVKGAGGLEVCCLFELDRRMNLDCKFIYLTYLQTCITLADYGCCLRVRNLDGYTGLELLEKLKKTNNELGQVMFNESVAKHMPTEYFCSGHLCRTAQNRVAQEMSNSR